MRGHDVVVNAAAWTAVDDAETHEAQAFAVNATGAANLARACAEAGAELVQVSTDYVFAGDATTPVRRVRPLAPRSAYGRTKAAGEWAVRRPVPAQPGSCAPRGCTASGGPNFVSTMARLAAERDTLDVVDDQRGQPTWTLDVARASSGWSPAARPYGAYHATSSGETTWCGLAREVFARPGPGPGPGAPDDHGGVPAAGAATGVLRARARRLAAAPASPRCRDWREALARGSAERGALPLSRVGGMLAAYAVSQSSDDPLVRSGGRRAPAARAARRAGRRCRCAPPG